MLKWFGQRAPRGKKLGATGEDLAAAHLKKQGFAILDRNFTCAAGELDLVARKGPLIVFAEVKTRRSERFGAPQAAVTPKKQKRIIKLANIYLKQKKLGHLQPRYDVIAVRWNDDGRPEIDHISAAFMTHPR